MWELQGLGRKKIPSMHLPDIAPTTANVFQNLISLQDQGIALPQLIDGLVEAIPYE